MKVEATEKRDVIVEVTIEQVLDGLFRHYGFDRHKDWMQDKSVIRSESQYHNHVDDTTLTADPKRVSIFKALKELEIVVGEA